MPDPDMEYRVEEFETEFLGPYRDWLLLILAEGWELSHVFPVDKLRRFKDVPFCFRSTTVAIHIFRRAKAQCQTNPGSAQSAT